MAELAAVSSAIGLVSFGIQICSGLIQYCSDLKGFEKDAAAIRRRVQGLANLLEVLNSILHSPQFEQTPSAECLTEAIFACEEGVVELEALLRKHTGQPNENKAASSASKNLQRALYPFRKSDIQSLNSTLGHLQNNLSTAFQVYQFQQLQTREDRFIARLEQAIQESTNFAQHSLDERLEILRSQLVDQPVVRNALEHRAAERQAAEQQLAPADIALDSPPQLLTLHRSQDRTRSCTCVAHREHRSIQIKRLFNFTKSSITQHNPICPLYALSKEEERINFTFNYPFIWNNAGVSTTVKITRNARAGVLSRTLLCQRIVPEDNPAFKLFRSEARKLMKYQSAEGGIENVRRELHRLFREGLACPTDMTQSKYGLDENSESLLSAVCEFIVHKLHSRTSPVSRPQLKLLIRDIVEVGANIDEVAMESLFTQSTAFQWFAIARGDHQDFQSAAWISEVLLEFGAHNTTLPRLDLVPFEMPVLKASRVLTEELDVSPLLRLIITRCASGLQDFLKCQQIDVNEGIFYGISALGVTYDWPEGLELLLEAEKNSCNIKPRCTDVFRWSIRSCNLECVRHLTMAGFAIPKAQFFDLLAARASFELPVATPQESETYNLISDLLFEEVRCRCERLYNLATANLDEQTEAQLDLCESTLPLANYPEIRSRLSVKGIDVAPLFEESYSSYDRVSYKASLYHCSGSWGTTVATMQELWDAKFRDTCAVDEFGHLPFDCLLVTFAYWTRADIWKFARQQLAVANWLLCHGGFPKIEGSDCFRQKLLLFAAKLGRVVGDEGYTGRDSMWTRLNEDRDYPEREGLCRDSWPRLFNAVFDPRYRDGCQCFCSSRGCSTVATYLRKYLGRWYRRTHRFSLKFLSQQLSSETQLWSAIIPEIIRLEIFELMDLRHTCCRLKFGKAIHCPCYLQPLDLENVKEIHHEDSEALQRFEELVTELIDEYWSSGLDLLDHLYGPFRSRMDNVLSELRGPLDPENFAAIEGLGVRLQSVDEEDDWTIWGRVQDGDWSSDEEADSDWSSDKEVDSDWSSDEDDSS